MEAAKSILGVKTTPWDLKNYPATNQHHYCWQRYNEFVLCLKRGGDDDSCKPARQLALSICTEIDVEQWDEQRENGNFLGVQVKKE
jgi:cytochrome c oxidase subunit 6b